MRLTKLVGRIWYFIRELICMAKTCKEFVEAYKSEYINCFTCRHWDREDFACNEPGELAKRNKVREFNAFDKQMKRNKSVIGPL